MLIEGNEKEGERWKENVRRGNRGKRMGKWIMKGITRRKIKEKNKVQKIRFEK